MSDTNGHQAETTTAEERKPPTLADIVREKTDDGRRIIDFFLDVMEARVEGAELCHRIDAAKQLVKYGSKDAARFIARYRDVPCGHSTRGRPNPADPCSDPDAAGRESAPGPFTEDFLTVLSAVDEDLMARLVRAQTADGFTVVEFLDDVMQDRVEGFKCHHRIAAAKELIVHIVRDEAPEPVPAESPPSANPEPILSTVEGPVEGPTSVHPEPVEGPTSVHPEPVGGPTSVHPEPVGGPTSVHPEPVEGPSSVHPEPVEGLTSVHPEPVEGPTSVHPEPVEGPTSAHPELVEGPTSVHPEPVLSTIQGLVEGAPPEPAERTQTFTVRQTRRRRTRKQRRQHGAARAAILGKRPNSERSNKEKQDEPAPVELTIAERRIKERLQQHWYEPDPWAAPIDSTHPGRSPPW